MIRRGVALLLVVVLGASFMLSNSTIDVMKPTEIIGNPEMYAISYDSHAPFNVTSDSDFELQGWPGNGSVTNPYLIQNLNITSTDSACIWIMNTTSYFIIEDCLFTSSVNDYTFNQPIFSITLTNVSNGKVVGNHIVDSYAAVSAYYISNCTISDNSLSVSFAGISITLGNSTVVSNNTQGYESCNYGMSINRCRNCTISRNEFLNITGSGLDVWYNYEVHIVENTFRAFVDEDAFSWVGIQLWGSELCTIQRNVLSDFRFWGLEVSGGSNNTVKENNITSRSVGILARTNNCTIAANNINGSNRAIEMVQANDTKVHGNSIIGRRTYDAGIVIYGGYDCDIYSNDISQVYQGIGLQGATRCNITGNSVTDGRYGFIFGWYSNWGVPEGPFFDCDIVDNTFDSGGVYPIIEHYGSWEFDTIRFTGNTVHGDPIGFFTNRDQETIDGDAFGQLLLVSCNEITISGGNFHDIKSERVIDIDYIDPGQASAITLVNCTACNLTNINFNNNTSAITLQDSFQCSITGGTQYYHSLRAISLSESGNINIANIDIRDSPIGIEIDQSHDCSISNCQIRDSPKGIELRSSYGCSISNCQIRDSPRGIELRSSYGCSISNCQIRDNEEGIFLRAALNCTLSHNTIFQNIDGIYMEDSDGADIFSNEVYLNNRGVLLNSTSDCLITQNNIYNNTGVGISLDTTANRNEIFNNTFAYNTPNAICEGTSNHWDNQVDTGNWWSDYNGTGAYIIDENDQDNFPLNTATTTTNETTQNWPWLVDPLLIGIVGGVVGIIALVIIIIDRRRVVVVD